MISLMNLDEWGNEESMEEERNSSKKKKKAQVHPCACGRTVCCGKHKNGQCACQRNVKERD